jgi:hypothetical protein
LTLIRSQVSPARPPIPILHRPGPALFAPGVDVGQGRGPERRLDVVDRGEDRRAARSGTELGARAVEDRDVRARNTPHWPGGREQSGAAGRASRERANAGVQVATIAARAQRGSRPTW